MLQHIKALLEDNAFIFLVLFLISLAANLFEITGFFESGKKRKEEESQRARDEERLQVYEFLFDAAQENIATDAELKELKTEILRRRGMIPKLQRRVELLQLAAKREIASQNISRTIAELRAGYDELQKLNEIHRNLGDLPTLPAAERKSIEQQISSTTHKLYELPRALTYRSLLLVLVILLLPSPVDQFLVLALLGVFLTTFFEIAARSRESSLIHLVFENKRAICLLSFFGAWYFAIREIDTFLGRPLSLITGALSESYNRAMHSSGPRTESFSVVQFLMDRSYSIAEFLVLLLALLLSLLHWRRIRHPLMAAISEAEKTLTAT